MKTTLLAAVLLLLAIAVPFAHANEDEDLILSNVKLAGEIEGKNIQFVLDFDLEAKRRNMMFPLLKGDLVLLEKPTLPKRAEIIFRPAELTYYLKLKYKAKSTPISVKFAARPVKSANDEWREATFTVPASRMRSLDVSSSRTDLEIKFPKALRVKRVVKDKKLTVTALLGPDRPFAVTWKPQVEKMEAKLVLASQANTILTLSPGALRQDSIYDFDIAQGKLRELMFTVPKALSITQVRGRNIRDWNLEKGKTASKLRVILNQDHTGRYGLQILSEMVLGEFPLQSTVPVVTPEGVIRSGGTITVGTNSAIQLRIAEAGGLSQIDASAFPKMILEKGDVRPIPRNKSFNYMFVASPYQLKLNLADIVPAYDVSERLTMRFKEEDLQIEGELELDVRDAAIRQLKVELDESLLVASVDTPSLDEYAVGRAKGGRKLLQISFKRPVIGRAVIRLRLELGRGPLGKLQEISALKVLGAKNERGYLVLVADQGVKLNNPKFSKLREVHTASIPMRVPNAQLAFRFREAAWNIGVKAEKDAATVLADAFHLVSIGEGIAYGSVVVNYLINGAPVDELHFKIPSTLKNIEFVGSDVQRWFNKGDEWTVKLHRRVKGEYNLGIQYTQPFRDGGKLLIGAVECRQVETQRGYLTLASNLNLRLAKPDSQDKGLLRIDREELPANYRLLVNSPILAAFKYVDAPHSLNQELQMYPREASLPILIEIAELRTDVTINKESRETQSVTKIRYKVKNLTGQYLTLALPTQTTYMMTRFVERGRDGREKYVDVKARIDREKCVQMIPIKRLRDPNQPLTIELEYGQAHDKLPTSGELQLTAPKSFARSTYSSWQVKVVEGWSVFHGEGGMRALQRGAVETGTVQAMVTYLCRIWKRGFWRWYHDMGFLIAGITLVVAAVGAWFINRHAALPVAFFCVAAAALWIGIIAVSGTNPMWPMNTLNGLRNITFTQAASLGEGESLVLNMRVVPGWRCFVTYPNTIIAATLAGLAMLLSFFVKSWRRALLWTVVIGAGVYVAAQLPPATLAVVHLLTWGLPLAVILILLASVKHEWRRLPRPATAILLCAFLFVGSAHAKRVRHLPQPKVILEHVEADLVTENDGVKIDLHLKGKIEDPVEIPLISSDAILMDMPDNEDLAIKQVNKRHVLVIKDDGEYDIKLSFLSPLAKADRAQRRAFLMHLPAALTNKVRLLIPKTAYQIESPSAILLKTTETLKSTSAAAVFAPGYPLQVTWKPRARRLKTEKAVFYVDVANLIRFDAGITEGLHQVSCQIAQGQLKQIELVVPDNVTVTAVNGRSIGAWRFDPAKHHLEVKFDKALTGRYSMLLKTQVSTASAPMAVKIGVPRVLKASHQRGTIGFAGSSAVTIDVRSDLQRLNVDDFGRIAARELMRCSKGHMLRAAYRLTKAEPTIQVDVKPVLPEIRVTESALFTVADDRLVYNGNLSVGITKAGLFSVSLLVPDGYDIDALSAPELSHWDDERDEGNRVIHAHFRRRFLGTVHLKLSMSRPEAELPREIDVPRVQVRDSLRHTGQLVLSSDRGVRLAVDKKQTKGVSDITEQNGRKRNGQLRYKLLKPDWQLSLISEVVKARVTVEYLQTARASEGMCRHRQILRFSLHNAGAKVFRIKAPKGAVGLQIDGPEIARQKEEAPGSGIWRIELERKWFDRPYPLTVSYETRFDRGKGHFELMPVQALDVDLQRGYVAVYASDRVELGVEKSDDSLQSTDPRRIPSSFGVRDLANAAFCVRSLSGNYGLTLSAKRHDAAEQLDAEVLSTSLTTVVTNTGATINRLQLNMRVNDRRHLQTRLPKGASVWALMVNQRAMQLSLQDRKSGVILVPLQFGTSDSAGDIELIYVTAQQPWQGKQHQYTGPQFDLPLKNVSWSLYMPEGYDYDDFEGNMSVVERDKAPVFRYGMHRYEAEVQAYNDNNLRMAEAYQDKGNRLAVEGKQEEAKTALQNAYNYSFADPNLNEDARVQLRGLIRQQAIVGLLSRRDHLRDQYGKGKKKAVYNLGNRFRPEDAARIQSSLSKQDSQNLERITERVIEAQEAAQGAVGQLAVHMPIRGKLVEFNRVLQVKPNAEMTIVFKASPVRKRAEYGNWLICAGLGLICAVILLLAAAVPKLLMRLSFDTIQEQEVNDEELGEVWLEA